MTASKSGSIRLAVRAAILAAVIACSTTSADIGRRGSDSAQQKHGAAILPREGSTCGIRDGLLMHGSRAGNRIALTFDVCPTSLAPAFAPDVVDFLEREHVPATFFVSGLWAESNPGDLRRLKRTPFFEIALHGHHHPRLVGAGADVIRAEIEEGRTALTRLGVAAVPLFRPPYWDQPPALSSVSRQSNVMPVIGDVGLGDPDPNRTADVMERDAVRWIQAGSIVVLHANGRGYATAQTVREIVPLLRRRGYVFVTVSELADECAMPPTSAGMTGASRRAAHE